MHLLWPILDLRCVRRAAVDVVADAMSMMYGMRIRYPCWWQPRPSIVAHNECVETFMNKWAHEVTHLSVAKHVMLSPVKDLCEYVFRCTNLEAVDLGDSSGDVAIFAAVTTPAHRRMRRLEIAWLQSATGPRCWCRGCDRGGRTSSALSSTVTRHFTMASLLRGQRA